MPEPDTVVLFGLGLRWWYHITSSRVRPKIVWPTCAYSQAPHVIFPYSYLSICKRL